MNASVPCCATFVSPVGTLLLMSDGRALISLKFEASSSRNDGLLFGEDDVIRQTRHWLDAYFNGQSPSPELLPLFLGGTPFQQMVWQLLLDIPYGTTVSYGYIARQVAAKMGRGAMSAQAIGQAVRSNPVGIIVPCHRVVGSNGALTGFAGGLEVKRWLLDFERKTKLK